MDIDRKPWEVAAALTEERLLHIASIMKDVRERTLELHDPGEGDGHWSLGCRIYERTINTIEGETVKVPWLEVIKNGLYFVILVDKVPIRFYKGDIDNPHLRTLRRHYTELMAQQLAFPWDASEWFWRIVIVPDIDGKVLRIVTAQFTESGNTRNIWEIPISSPVHAFTTVDETYHEPVKLSKPVVEPRTDKNIGEDEDEKRQGESLSGKTS
jgi:hypothetical protein